MHTCSCCIWVTAYFSPFSFYLKASWPNSQEATSRDCFTRPLSFPLNWSLQKYDLKAFSKAQYKRVQWTRCTPGPEQTGPCAGVQYTFHEELLAKFFSELGKHFSHWCMLCFLWLDVSYRTWLCRLRLPESPQPRFKSDCGFFAFWHNSFLSSKPPVFLSFSTLLCPYLFTPNQCYSVEI